MKKLLSLTAVVVAMMAVITSCDGFGNRPPQQIIIENAVDYEIICSEYIKNDVEEIRWEDTVSYIERPLFMMDHFDIDLTQEQTETLAELAKTNFRRFPIVTTLPDDFDLFLDVFTKNKEAQRLLMHTPFILGNAHRDYIVLRNREELEYYFAKFSQDIFFGSRSSFFSGSRIHSEWESIGTFRRKNDIITYNLSISALERFRAYVEATWVYVTLVFQKIDGEWWCVMIEDWSH